MRLRWMAPSGAAIVVLGLLAGGPLAGCASPADSYSDTGAGYASPQPASAADFDQAEHVTVVLTEYAFDPPDLSFKQGRPYVLRLENKGAKTHFVASEPFFRAISVHSLSGHGQPASPFLKAVGVAPGEARELAFVPERKGTYRLICSAPLHAAFGMVGKITID
jgi:uncharacterized cupredoxin-like copper-binding protein